MTKHSLTTTKLKVIETEDDDRKYLLCSGLFDGCAVVYVRIGDAGDADAILAKEGTTAMELAIPSGRPVYAWTNAGTAELCTMKVS